MKKQFIFKRAGYVTVLSVVMALGAGTALAQRAASTAASQPAGTVTKQVALAAVRKHKEALVGWRKQIDSLYDYNTVTATMKSAFERNGVTGRAAEHAASWGQNIVYLSLGGMTFFYRYHLARLVESEQRLTSSDAKWVKQAELDYLERGMKDWDTTAKQVSDSMAQMVEHLAQQAVLLDKRSEANQKRQAAPPDQKPKFDRLITSLEDEAKLKRRTAAEMDARVKRTGRAIYFESIGAEPLTPQPCTVNPTVTAPPPLNLITLPKFDGGLL